MSRLLKLRHTSWNGLDAHQSTKPQRLLQTHPRNTPPIDQSIGHTPARTELHALPDDIVPIIPTYLGHAIRAVIHADAVSLISHPFAFVNVPAEVEHLAQTVALPIDPVPDVNAAVGVPALAKSVTLIVQELADIAATVGVVHGAFAVSLAERVALTYIGLVVCRVREDGAVCRLGNVVLNDCQRRRRGQLLLMALLLLLLLLLGGFFLFPFGDASRNRREEIERILRCLCCRDRIEILRGIEGRGRGALLDQGRRGHRLDARNTGVEHLLIGDCGSNNFVRRDDAISRVTVVHAMHGEHTATADGIAVANGEIRWTRSAGRDVWAGSGCFHH